MNCLLFMQFWIPMLVFFYIYIKNSLLKKYLLFKVWNWFLRLYLKEKNQAKKKSRLLKIFGDSIVNSCLIT